MAARIFIKIQLSNNNDSFPGSVHDQANWWASNYINLTENSTTFVNRVQTYEAINREPNLKFETKSKTKLSKHFEIRKVAIVSAKVLNGN